MKLNEWCEQERGRVALLARRVGLPPAYISQFNTGSREVPVHRCGPIEAATGGAVSRRDLRPDDWHVHWPELAEPAQEQRHAA